MPIKFGEIYNQSNAKVLLERLFLPKELKKSTLLSKLEFFYLKNLSEIFILLALAIVWYKTAIVNYFSLFSLSYLPLMLIVLAFLFSKKEKQKITKSIIWYLVFIFISLISGLIAAFTGINANLILLGWILFAQFGLVIFSASLLISKTKLIKGIIFLSLPMTFYALYQNLSHVQSSSLWVSTLEKGTTRVFGFLGSPNVLGSMLAIVVFISFGIYLKEKKNLYLLISIINIFVVALTLSRGAWLGLAAGIIAMAIFYNYKYILYSPLAILLLLIPQIRNRFIIALSPSYYLDSTLDGRIWALINGFHIFKQYPILGTGPGTYGGQLALNYASPVYLQSIQNGYTALYFTDNQFLEILVQTGIIGFIAFVGFIISKIFELIENYLKKNSKMSLAVLGAFVCFLTSAIFANNLEFTAVAMPMAIMLGVVNE